MLEEHHERGAELADRDTLVARVLANNETELRKIARRFFPDMSAGEAFGLPFEERKPYGLMPSYTIATVPYPQDREQNHTIAFGTTGTGKTTVLKELITQALERGNSCVIFDLTGTFVESFYDPRRDHILNLNDERCEHWSVFHDAAHDGEFLAAAEALIPDTEGADGGFWEKAARTLFVEMCAKLQAEGKGTNRNLISALMTATLSEIYDKLKGTIADPLTNPKAERMANSVRGVFNSHAKALMYLPDKGEPFSIRKWAETSGERPSILFVTSRYVDMPLNRPMLSMWMNIAIHGLMALPRTSHIRCWFFFDELGALHYLPAIEDGMQSARNYGGAFVLGVHSLASLRERYHEHGSTKIISLAYTKLILGTGDRDTAEECSKLIGYRQVRTMDEAYSYGASQTRDASTISPTRKEEALVFPDDITNLKNLTGYVRFREGFPAAFVTIPYVDYPRRAEGFLLRPPPRTHALPPPDQTDTDEDSGGPEATPAGEQEAVQERSGDDFPEVLDRTSLETEQDRQNQERAQRSSPATAAMRHANDNAADTALRTEARGLPAPNGEKAERTPGDEHNAKASFAVRSDAAGQNHIPASRRRSSLEDDDTLDGANRRSDSGNRAAPTRSDRAGSKEGPVRAEGEVSSAGLLARREAALTMGDDAEAEHDHEASEDDPEMGL